MHSTQSRFVLMLVPVDHRQDLSRRSTRCGRPSSSSKCVMSNSCWRSAEALHKRRVQQLSHRKAEERARLRLAREVEEWKITGEPPFRPKKRHYPHGGGVGGVVSFLASTERAVHLYDRGKVLTDEMKGVMTTLQRREAVVREACARFGDKHASHKHPQRLKDNWILGAEELNLFVAAAARMTPRQRKAFTDVLAPPKNKSEEYIGPLEPLAARLQRAKNASIQQAISGELFDVGASGQGKGRFARSRAVSST